MSNGRIRDESKEDVEYKRTRMSPAKKGHHKMKTFQHMYKDIHRFIGEREWAPIEHGKPIGGVTWIELFILFDISGARSDKGDHIKDPQATKRANERKQEREQKGRKEGKKYKGETAIVKPSLQEELKRFKDIFRHITKHEIET